MVSELESQDHANKTGGGGEGKGAGVQSVAMLEEFGGAQQALRG